jgi:hypothetical protein
MTITVKLVLMILAIVCFALAAYDAKLPGSSVPLGTHDMRLLAGGLGLWALATIINV